MSLPLKSVHAPVGGVSLFLTAVKNMPFGLVELNGSNVLDETT